MKKLRYFFSVIILGLFLFGCGTKKIERSHIPKIKEKLVQLQNAVKEQNRALIDSLLSPRILEKQQSSDSLLKYVYNTNDFIFEQFGGASIVYTNEQGRIDCYIMDTTHFMERPFTIYIVLEHEMWLVSSFAEGNLKDSL